MPERELLVAHLERAKDWLLNWSQPEEAILFHLGINATRLFNIAGQNVSVGLIPHGAKGGGRVVVAFEPRPQYTNTDRAPGDWTLVVFRAYVVNAIRAACISSLGPMFDEWNGTGCPGYSFQATLDVSQEVERCLRNYDRLYCPSCPLLQKPPERRGSPVFCDCEWRAERYSLCRKPEGWR